MNWPRIRKNARRVWIAGGLSFTAWMVWSFQAHGVDSTVLVSSTTVEVTEGDGSWRFVPIEPRRSGGLVLLQGGMVDPRAYFPLARALAEEGHPVVVMSLPFRVAPSEESEGSVLRAAQAAVRQVDPAGSWVLAGHSRGAAIATRTDRHAVAAYRLPVVQGPDHGHALSDRGVLRLSARINYNSADYDDSLNNTFIAITGVRWQTLETSPLSDDRAAVEDAAARLEWLHRAWNTWYRDLLTEYRSEVEDVIAAVEAYLNG